MAVKRILLIDDEDDIRTIARISLETIGGFEVLLAGGGEEGLEVSAREIPDMILLDVMMPGLDGPATLKRLKGNPGSADIPVVFLTAKAQQTELDRLKKMGAEGVLTKPFDPMKLPDQVRAFLRAEPLPKEDSFHGE